MIKCESNHGHLNAELNGNLIEIAADTLVIVSGIYKGILAEDEVSSVKYKNIILNKIEDAFNAESGTLELSKDEPDNCKKSSKELIKEFKDSLKIKRLKDMLDDEN